MRFSSKYSAYLLMDPNDPIFSVKPFPYPTKEISHGLTGTQLQFLKSQKIVLIGILLPSLSTLFDQKWLNSMKKAIL